MGTYKQSTRYVLTLLENAGGGLEMLDYAAQRLGLDPTQADEMHEAAALLNDYASFSREEIDYDDAFMLGLLAGLYWAAEMKGNG